MFDMYLPECLELMFEYLKIILTHLLFCNSPHGLTNCVLSLAKYNDRPFTEKVIIIAKGINQASN